MAGADRDGESINARVLDEGCGFFRVGQQLEWSGCLQRQHRLLQLSGFKPEPRQPISPSTETP